MVSSPPLKLRDPPLRMFLTPSLNKFFDPSTPSMRKGRDGGKTGEKKKRIMKIVATTSLPAVDRPNADRWNAVRSCQK